MSAVIINGRDTATNNPQEVKSTSGAAHTTLTTLLSGEDQTNNVLRVESQNESYSAARSTSDVTIGATGAIGDYLERVVLTAAVTVATLIVKDKSGTTLAAFLTTDTVGTVREVGAVAAGAGFAVTLDAAGAGTVTCIGRFT